jgi:thiosulfate/3-mercaptopyruvate sulfurtransferase
MNDKSPWLVSTQWLADRLGSPDVVAVDGSFYLPAQKRDPEAEFLAGHIPGAVRFDVDAVSDHANPAPHMLPSKEFFADSMGKLGISETDTIVCYDGLGLFASPRIWWTFRLFGAKNVYILDGGLPRWTAEKRPLETGPAKRSPRKFNATGPAPLVASFESVRATLADKSAQVVDARAANRFAGEAPEPRPGLPSGHMPGSFNVPSSLLVENGALASPDKIKAAFAAGGIDIDKPVVTSCGSGVSAAILWLALDSLGKTPKALYDGSWSEWASRPDAAIATGAK